MQRGSLLLAGGGATTAAMIRNLRSLVRGEKALFVVLPHTSSDAVQAGQRSAALLQRYGLPHVRSVEADDPATVAAALNEASGVWIPGGDQNRFMQRVGAHREVQQALRALLLRGGVVGGTSAGASLIGAWMPAGETRDTALRPDAVVTTRGLGLLPNVIVDQHLLRRQRLQRLVGAVLQHPELIGIGLDEDAWAVVSAGRLRVQAGQVVMVQAVTPPRLRGGLFTADNLHLRLLAAGEETSLG
ncbi:MAG: cyanophycinase [Armatimonadetes bacterium]|nr:cyanophycinase [Armatimonadota bacterium]